ncbi:MAG: DUF11 domain-containing protein [Acidobacteriota bacterium]|nr:DUF11 domain-containing protein [Acidobacteriota bacterium]
MIVALMIAFSGISFAQSTPDFSIQFNSNSIGVDGTSTLVYTITNNTGTSLRNLSFSNTLPAGLTIASPSGAENNCPGLDAVFSAPAGGDTISYSGGGIATGSSCSLSVNVTGSVPDVYTNITGDLISDAGNSGPATADLTIATDRPGLSKSFSPSTIEFGGVSTLTFTVNNSANPSQAFGFSFSDNLPTGMTVALPANATSDCGSFFSFNAAPGASSISYFNGVAPANGTCTVSVDVTASTPGELENVSADLLSSGRSGGFATASLTVQNRPFFDKRFLTSTALPGETVNLEFSITNQDRFNTATGLTFTDDLDAMLSGATAAGLPLSDVCGEGSLISGGSLITLSDASLAPGATCTFTVPVSIPGTAAPGTYTNTTSDLSGDRGTIAGPASDDLTIVEGPSLGFVFLDNPVSAGDTVTAQFTIDNNSTVNTASDLAFTLPINDVLGGATITAGGSQTVCGGTVFQSVISDVLVLNLSGGSLAAGDSCSFTIDIAVPISASGSNYTFTTSNLTATVGGSSFAGAAASDTLTVVSAPSLVKAFIDDPVSAGDTVTLEYTLFLGESAPLAITDIAFTDDLGAALAGATASVTSGSGICGTGSTLTGGSVVSFSGGSLSPGDSCTFSVTVQTPSTAVPGSYPSTTSNVTGNAGSLAVVTNPGTDNLDIGGFSLTKSYSPSVAVAGDTVTATYTFTNDSTLTATSVNFNDDYTDLLPGITLGAAPAPGTCGSGSVSLVSGDQLTFINGEIAPQSTCSFTLDITLPAAVEEGIYTSSTSAVTTVIDGNALTFPGGQASLEIINPLSISRTFTEESVLAGGTVTANYTITNDHPTSNATNVTFTEDFDALLSGLAATGLPIADACGAGSLVSGTGQVSLTGGLIAPQSSCSFSVTLSVPAGAAVGTQVNAGPITAQADINGNTVSNQSGSDSFQVEQVIIDKIFLTESAPGATVTLQITLTNPNESALFDIAFTDDLDAMAAGSVAAGLPLTDVCGEGSVLSGTSTISLTGGIISGGACTIDVPVVVGSSVTPGTYTNTTSQVTSTLNGVSGVSRGASATLVVNPNPGFSKAFTPDAIFVGESSRLVFTIDNTDNNLRAREFTFTDVLPAGLEVATTPNVVNGCLEGTVTATAGSNTISYVDGVINPDSSCMIAIDVTATAAGDLVNVSGNAMSTSGDSGVATATLRVNPAPTFSKGFLPAVIDAGEESTLSLVIDNTAGTLPVTGLAFTDVLPAGMQIAAVPSASTSCTGGTLTAPAGGDTISYSGGTVAAGQICTASVKITATTAGDLVNTTGDLTSDAGNSGSATATLTVEAGEETDLSISAVANPTTVIAGKTLIYTIDVTNNGPADAQDVVLTNTLPTGVTVVSSSGCGEDPNASGTCTLGTVPAGTTRQVILETQVDSGFSGNIIYRGDVASSTAESNPGDESVVIATATKRKSRVKVRIRLVGLPFKGRPLVWKITVKNRGPSDADNVRVFVYVPRFFKNVEWTCTPDPNSSCTPSGTGNLDDRADIRAGEKVVYRLSMQLPGRRGKVSMTAQADVPDGSDDDLSDNVHTISTGDFGTGMSATLEVDALTETENMGPLAGDTVLFRTVLTNHTETAMTDDPDADEFTADLPEGLSLVNAVMLTGDGRIDLDTADHSLTWNGSVPPLEEVELQIEARIEMEAEGKTLLTQGLLYHDTDGDGVNDSVIMTDDPSLPGEADPAELVLGRAATDVPVLSPFGLLLFVLGLIGAAVYQKRRRTAS